MNPADLFDVKGIEESLRGVADGAIGLAKSVAFLRAGQKAVGVTGLSSWTPGRESHTVTVAFPTEADAYEFVRVMNLLASTPPAPVAPPPG